MVKEKKTAEPYGDAVPTGKWRRFDVSRMVILVLSTRLALVSKIIGFIAVTGWKSESNARGSYRFIQGDVVSRFRTIEFHENKSNSKKLAAL